MENMVGDAVNGAVSKGKEAANSFLGNIFGDVLGFPMRFISGALGGAFNGALWFGGFFFLLQATGLMRPIALAIGGQPLVDKIASLDKNNDGTTNIGTEIMNSALLGAGLGAITDGTKKGFGVDDKSATGQVVTLGIMAAVTVAAVMLSKHQVAVAGNGDAAQPDVTPSTGPATTPVKA